MVFLNFLKKSCNPTVKICVEINFLHFELWRPTYLSPQINYSCNVAHYSHRVLHPAPGMEIALGVMSMAVSRADHSVHWGTWGHLGNWGSSPTETEEGMCLLSSECDRLTEWLGKGWNLDFLMARAIQDGIVGYGLLCINKFSFHSLLGSTVLSSPRRFWVLGFRGLPGGWRWLVRSVERSLIFRKPASPAQALELQGMVLAFRSPAVVPLLEKCWGCRETGELLANFPFIGGQLSLGDQDTDRNRHSESWVVRRSKSNPW